MSISYKYEIQELRCEPIVGSLTKVVTEVVYEYIGKSESGIISKLPGLVTLEVPLEQSFTPIEEINEATVISWIESIADVGTAKQMIDNEIKYKSGLIYKGESLPWNSIV